MDLLLEHLLLKPKDHIQYFQQSHQQVVVTEKQTPSNLYWRSRWIWWWSWWSIFYATPGTGNTPPVAPAQGFNGGNDARPGTPGSGEGGGGGGGASAVGGTSAHENAGPGGLGSFIADAFIGPCAPSYGTPYSPGSLTRFFAGGGGGATTSTNSGQVGGVGGGGTEVLQVIVDLQMEEVQIHRRRWWWRRTNMVTGSKAGSGIVMIGIKFQ